MVHKVLEGLRDEAFELARDMGIEEITASWRNSEVLCFREPRRRPEGSSEQVSDRVHTLNPKP